jgi:hypothetical protein
VERGVSERAEDDLTTGAGIREICLVTKASARKIVWLRGMAGLITAAQDAVSVLHLVGCTMRT